MKFRSKLCVLVVSFLSGTISTHANTIDQDSPIADFPNLSYSGTVQSFQQSSSNISGAGILISSNLSANVVLSIWDSLPTQTGVALATGTTGFGGAAPGWYDVFWAPIQVTPDTTYYLFINNSGGLISGNNNKYSRGEWYAGSSAPSGFSVFPQYDMSFRTYTSPVAVPEPTSLLLMLVGAMAIGVKVSRNCRSR